MALAAAFLDQLRERTLLSGLISRSVKLTRAGREWKACCPFHAEKSASFTVNDDKGFYHCFGCGAHGDVFRWLTDHDGLQFIDAVRELAQAAGVEMPAPSPEAAEAAARIETVRAALDAAQARFVANLAPAGAVMEYLSARGVGPDAIDAFGIGFARGGEGSLKGSGIGQKLGLLAGLLATREDGSVREMFWDRVTVPIHDARGRLTGFGGRVWPGRRGDTPKFVNSPDSPIFDKGRTLFNLHRAAPAARAAKRLLVVEGYFDVIALAGVGVTDSVAPMGTALTEAQLERCWRVHHRPILLFDGDGAGRKAAVRACKLALAFVGPGHELAVALLPGGPNGEKLDPDDLARSGGAEAIEAVLGDAAGLHQFLFDAVVEAALELSGGEVSPEVTAAIWAELSALAATIRDDETRGQYLGQWRARFEREVSGQPKPEGQQVAHSLTWDDSGDYAFPDDASDSERRLIMIVRAKLAKRAARREINEEIKDIDAMAKAVGFDPREINSVISDIESDLKHGAGVREEAEMVRVLYPRGLR